MVERRTGSEGGGKKGKRKGRWVLKNSKRKKEGKRKREE